MLWDKSHATPAVFVAKKFSARLKKKALAMRDEKKILGYLEEWMDSKYLRIRDAFMRIDTDGSGELAAATRLQGGGRNGRFRGS